jgi:hypothetical protein
LLNFFSERGVFTAVLRATLDCFRSAMTTLRHYTPGLQVIFYGRLRGLFITAEFDAMY